MRNVGSVLLELYDKKEKTDGVYSDAERLVDLYLDHNTYETFDAYVATLSSFDTITVYIAREKLLARAADLIPNTDSVTIPVLNSSQRMTTEEVIKNIGLVFQQYFNGRRIDVFTKNEMVVYQGIYEDIVDLYSNLNKCVA